MILQALKEYYDRKATDPESGIAPRGWFQGRIDFVIVLTKEGEFKQLDCEQTTKNGKRVSHPCMLPYIGKQALKHTMSGTDANLLWDNATFVLGVGKNGNKKLASFIAVIKERLGDIEDPALKSVLKFLENGQRNPATFAPVVRHSEYGEEIRDGRAYMTFRLINDEPPFVFQRSPIKARISEAFEPSQETGTCLVTGEAGQPIELCHLVIKNLYGARKDPNVVSFNKQAFNSFGKDQSANAPVGKAAAFAYTTALNYLTARESKQKLQVGDATAVFWSDRDTNLEKQVTDFFSEPPKDDPDRGVKAVESLFKAVETGAFSRDEGTARFFVLGMTPFGPRIAVRFWIVDTVKGMSVKISAHFTDTEIVVPMQEKKDWPRWLSLNALLAATANETKYDNKKPNLVRFRNKYYDVKPNFEGDTMRAILEGLPYPQTLLQAAIRRIRAEHEVTYPRAALIKACLNRSAHFNNPKQKEELHVSLDLNNTNIGYRLGRLFATLEKIQQEAIPGINATIRDKFYGAASSTPVTVFGNLMRLKNHHLAKLESVGRRVQFDKLLGEIMSGISDFAPYLRLEDQGRFAIGYYHQMQDFYTKKMDNQQPKGN